ncbi:MAG: YCF48-related protein [candidate division KSB1 bacterium]|nr:YCF48-related protein [candidate division KSB1 bacterium]
MRIILATMILLSLAVPIHAGEWQWTVPSEKAIPIEIFRICMIDGLNGWIVGNDELGGRIYRTSDGWVHHEEIKINLVPNARYYDIAFADALHGWIIGKNGVILHTEDGGNTWHIQASNLTANDLRKLSVIDSKHAFVCGSKSTILFTKDGQHWRPAVINDWFPEDLLGIDMFDSSHGIAVGRNGKIFFTKNGTEWFPPFSPPLPLGKDYYDVAMVDQSKAWLVGSYKANNSIKCIFAKTEDGGDSWQLRIPPDTSFSGLFAVTFPNNSTGIAAGSRGCVFMTRDNENWVLLDRQFGNDGQTIAVVGDQIWIAGRGGTINYSSDFGATWTILPSMTSNFLYKIRAVDNSRILAIGYSSILEYSDNGGIDWKTMAVIADNESAIQLWGIDFANDQLGWIVGTGGFIARTRDGCKSWERQGKDFTDLWLHDIWASDENDLWIVGEKGLIMHSMDGGDAWHRNPKNLTSKDLFDIEGLNQNQLVAIGDNSTFLYSHDGGRNWNFARHNLSKNVKINSVHLIDETHAWAVGEEGTVMFSNDNGVNWKQQPFISDLRLEGIHFKDANIGYIVGENGLIFETIDGGKSWHPVAEGLTKKYLKSIEITKDGKILICGYYGTIIRYGPPVTPSLADKKPLIPMGFVFQENYPNPFNERTTLSYQLPVQTHVHLAVYNLMGQLVESLVNKEQSGGSYSVSWNAAGQSSGVYLFKLTTPEFSAVRKGLFLK